MTYVSDIEAVSGSPGSTGGPEHYEQLAVLADRHMDLLEEQPPVCDAELHQVLGRHGFTRRELLKWATVMTVTLGLPPFFDTRVARAARLANRQVLVWQELQSCTGNSEALLRNTNPDIDTIVLDMLSLEYMEVLMAPSGYAAEEQLRETIEKHRGRYLAVFEGSLPLEENFLTIGGRSGLESAREIARHARAIVNAGTCAAYGGIPAARPNPTGAVGVGEFLKKEGIYTPIINLPGCPVNSVNVVGALLEMLMFGRPPELDAFGRPVWAYGIRIHDKCERRGNFDAGEFVEGWNDVAGLKKASCLYKVGCKGPFTYNNCGQVRFNNGTSWPVQAGRGCIGCSEPGCWDTLTPFEEPVSARVYSIPFGTDATADQIGKALLGATALGIAAHAVLTALRAVGGKKEV